MFFPVIREDDMPQYDFSNIGMKPVKSQKVFVVFLNDSVTNYHLMCGICATSAAASRLVKSYLDRYISMTFDCFTIVEQTLRV